MLLERRSREGILDGSVTVLFRRWRRRQALAGRIYRTSAGLVAVDSVQVVDPAALTDEDARAGGYASAEQLRAGLRGAPTDPVYRLEVRRVDEPDPWNVLAARAELTADEVAELRRRLDRLDGVSNAGPWTAATLSAIATNPGRRAGDLADAAGRERRAFKTDVRKLKALGLIVSLQIGYRLSPRGEEFLRLTRPGHPSVE